MNKKEGKKYPEVQNGNLPSSIFNEIHSPWRMPGTVQVYFCAPRLADRRWEWPVCGFGAPPNKTCLYSRKKVSQCEQKVAITAKLSLL